MLTIQRDFSSIRGKEKMQPCLYVIYGNPTNKKRYSFLSLIDTGADEFALPVGYGRALGFQMEKKYKYEVGTVNGEVNAYRHKVQIWIRKDYLGIVTVDFLPKLHTPLIGVNSFLAKFALAIDYSKMKFILKQQKR